MRVIKFRIWNCTGKVMHHWSELVEKNKIHLLAHQQHSYPVMQFTGLLDVNGVEIYENSEIDNEFVVATKGCDYVLINISSGDILRLQDYYSGARGNVKVTREYAGIPEDTKRRTN